MWRLILLLLVTAALMAFTLWLNQLPGGITLASAAYRIEVPYAAVFVGGVIAFLIAGVAWATLYAIFRGPAAVLKRLRLRRERDTLLAIGEGFLAIAAGDYSQARRQERLAQKHLPDAPSAVLLKAQVAQAQGNNQEAKIALESLLGKPGLTQAGRRGLYLQAVESNQQDSALEHARAAFQAWPHLTWAGDALFQVQCQMHDWDGALDTLEKLSKRRSPNLTNAVVNRRRAVLLTAQAMALPVERSDQSLKLYKKALKLAPGLVPAASMAASILGRMERYKQAESTLTDAWKTSPHPDLADQYVHLHGSSSPAQRLKRTRDLIGTDFEDGTSALVVANAAFEAGEYDLAETTLRPFARMSPTQSSCLLMADIARRQGGQESRIAQWTEQARTAPPDPKWVADGVAQEYWSPVSPVTGELDAMVWKSPVRIHQSDVPALRRGPHVVDEPRLVLSTTQDMRETGTAGSSVPHEPEPSSLDKRYADNDESAGTAEVITVSQDQSHRHSQEATSDTPVSPKNS